MPGAVSGIVPSRKAPMGGRAVRPYGLAAAEKTKQPENAKANNNLPLARRLKNTLFTNSRIETGT
jgi:hypothetical protein